LDEIIFTDTLEEFKEMYVYIKKLKDYFKRKYNKDITILKPKLTFDHWAYGSIKKESSKRLGMIRGFPSKDGMCYWRRESKVHPIDRYLAKKYKNEEITIYIGYTKGENRSIKETENFKYSYPLQDLFPMSEDDCKSYLINEDMENPLYKHFSRTGCAMCPFQSDKSWYQVYINYPDVWENMKQRELKLQELEDSGKVIINKFWFMGNKTCNDMELEFKLKNSQGSLFDFSDEPIKDCFCKI